MKNLLLALSTLMGLFFSYPLFSQDNPAIKTEATELRKNKVTDSDTLMGWKKNGFFNLNFAQTALTNWAAGGTGSYAILGTFNYSARYKTANLLWENNLLLNYGMVKADGSDIQKNDDRIEINSRIGRKAFGNWYYTGFASFRTQFDATFTEGKMVSNFMSPAWLQFALGLNYSKDDRFGVLIAPIAGKFTIVNDERMANAGNFGVKPAVLDPLTGSILTPGQMFRPEIGAYVSSFVNFEIMKNVTLNSRIDLFNNYSDENRPNRKNIDVNWENRISMKANKWITCTLLTHLIYDQDILVDIKDRPNQKGPRTQFKQVLGVGLSYKF